MGNQMRYLSKPVTECYFENGAGKTYSYTAASMQGWRKYQEDRFVCIPDFYEDCSFFGVYDGHGGSEIAEFLRQRLHLEVMDSLQTQDDLELALHLGFLSCDASIMEPENIAMLNDMVEEENRGTALQILKNQKSLEAAISRAGVDQSNVAGPSARSTFTENLFNAGGSAGANMQLIQNFAGSCQGNISSKQDSEELMEVERPLDYLLSDEIEPSDPEDEDYNIQEDEESSSTESEEETNCISAEEFLFSEPGHLSGSTATVAIILQNRIYVANVGDSRCVLSRNGQAIDMSLDHKPDDPEEKARIIGAGGSVSNDGRVDNCLNLSRAFGDFKFKGDSFVPSQQCITAEPFIKSIDIEKDDDFLIIASDGIWNSMSSQEVVDYINIRLQAKDCDLMDICEEMFKFTLAADKDNDGTGCDNMCCIIIKFGSKGDSSFIHKASISNEVMSSGDFLKQEGKNVNVPTSGSADQMTTNMSVKTTVDEKNSHQNSQDSHLKAHYSWQSMQDLGNSHWINFSLWHEKCNENLIVKLLILIDEVKKRFANHVTKVPSGFSQSDMQRSMYSLKLNENLNLKDNLETSVPPILEDMTSCKKILGLEKPFKLDYLRDMDFVVGYVEQISYYFKKTRIPIFPGLQINNVVNLEDTICMICPPISSEKQYLCNKYSSNIFNNAGHLIRVGC